MPALKVDKIAGIEARGFILGGAIAHQLSAGFIPIRKKGKLPHETVRVAYSLEYGLDEMEMHKDAVKPGEKVILVDDLIATGGTAEGAVKLLSQMGADIVAACFVIDLPDLGGRKKLEDARRDGEDADFLRGALTTEGYSAFTSTALSNSMTLAPVESTPSARTVSDAPAWPRRHRPVRKGGAAVAHRLAGIDRLQPLHVADAGRGAKHRRGTWSVPPLSRRREIALHPGCGGLPA